MKTRFEPNGIATGIGSFPFKDPEEAVRTVLKYLPECPFWPQLPRLSRLEGMTEQYVEGFPGLVETSGSERVDTVGKGQSELPAFYEKALSGSLEGFSLPEERAKGFYAFEKILEKERPQNLKFVKGHVTGPVTLASGLKDQNGRELVNDETFREAVAVKIAKNALWQVRRLERFGVPVVIFLDEPVMEVFGSAFSTLDKETVLSLWEPSLKALDEAGAISGIHCCGNTDWELLFDSGVGIVNFDAFNYVEKMLLYADKAKSFMDRGGALAWGIVPTSPEIKEVSAGDLLKKLNEGFSAFEKKGIPLDLLRRQCLLTPSCGMGSLSVEDTVDVLKKLSELSRMFRSQY
ncbi:hypothetical protein EPN96_08190 [bacterium]|nr:MAG: hypothetical protein EPN96_08190 [bacterium]